MDETESETDKFKSSRGNLAVGWYAGRGALLLDGVSVSGGCGPPNLGGPSIRRNESIVVPARARQPCSLS
jgi:hypothetical protein